MAALRTENAKLRAIINEREERNYELCLRFLRMKDSKNDLKIRFQRLENEYLQVITNLMEKIDEARDEFNFIIDKKFKKPLHPTNAKYLRLVQQNSGLAFDNISLRMEIQKLKKELNKFNFQQENHGRKITEKQEMVDLSDGKERKIKPLSSRQKVDEMRAENGGQKEKGSDTDSNYMSKTSTTEPSTESVRDDKSNENISGMDSKDIGKNKASCPQVPFSDEILYKIFQKVESQSSLQSPIESNKEINAEMRIKQKSAEQTKAVHKGQEEKPKEILPLLSKCYVPCSLNSKKFHEVAANLATQRLVIPTKTTKGTHWGKGNSQNLPLEANQSQKRSFLSGNQPKDREDFREVKHGGGRLYSEMDEIEDSPREGVRRFASLNHIREEIMQNRLHTEKMYEIGSPRRFRARKERRQKSLFADSCGLEEKLDSEGEAMSFYKYKKSKRISKSEKTTHQTVAKRLVKKEDKLWSNLDKDTNSEDSVNAPDTAKNRNCISLHDELMEATKFQSHKDDPFWRREMNLHTLITKKSASSSKTYSLHESKSRKKNRLSVHTTEHLEEDKKSHRSEGAAETKILGKCDEGTQCRSSSLQEGGLGESKEDIPCAVTHKSIATSPTAVVDGDKDDVLRVLLPPATISSALSILSDEIGKGSSISLYKDGGPSPQLIQPQVSRSILADSNLPSSCTSLDLVDSSVGREHCLVLRTLSAPALIESDWLNKFKLCEMKDCSTNT